MRTFMIAAVVTALPAMGFAVGDETDTPPTTTGTTTTCTDGMVYDSEIEACVEPTDSSMNDTLRMDAVRELAYAGRLMDATRVLDAMADQEADRVLTYRGFIARVSGDLEAGKMWYAKALAQNPDNLLARSYMGQGFVEDGQVALARAQLSEIRQRGGRATWAEFSLRSAIERGQGYAY